MGVPRFFSWITRRYPLCMQDLDDYPIPEIDCLYLDMNGIIYKCSKDDSIIFRDQVMSRKAEEIWLSIFNYVNSIVDMINPKKLLFLGLDGVAPRAKMNNQRSRRFKSAKDYQELERKLEYYGDAKNEEEFKNNCITPGTQFMSELNRQLRFFIAKKIEEDVKWRGFNIIFSGADVPGEGEHKIMDFIRRSTDLKVYDDDTTHCLYGADADLIMLGMSLKIKKLCIIREEFVIKSDKTIISQTRCMKQINFKIIYINILKQYFDLQYKELASDMKIPYNAQRVINDFVFLCFFIGNDFLPRCYCYDIRDGHLEMLIYGFKKFLKQCDEYLIQEDSINLKELERLTKILGEFEGEFISSRSEESQLAYKGITAGNQSATTKEAVGEFQKQFRAKIANSNQRLRNEEEFLLELKTLYMNDEVAAKSTYYKAKLKFTPAQEPDKLTHLIEDYIQGLHYVYQYYFGGLPSWEWYFPHYYAPLVADLASYLGFMNTSSIALKPFNKSLPYEPFKQLMCILPKESASLLPVSLQPLIQNDTSPLRSPYDYFPDKVEVDAYGGLREHEFINILPFLDQAKMTEVYKSVPLTAFTQAELSRNKFTLNELYRYSPTNKITIKTFYTQISDFAAPMTMDLIDFGTADVLKLQSKEHPGTKSVNQIGELTFPTLYMRKFTSTFVYASKKDRRIEITISNTEEDKVDYRLGAEVYFGYPNESHGRVLAILTPDNIKAITQFDIFQFLSDPDLVQSDLNTPQDCWRQTLRVSRKKGLQLAPEKIYFLKQSKISVRKFNGEYARSYFLTLNTIQPATLVAPVPKYSYTHTLFKPKSIKEEFLVNEVVVVLATKWAGSKGIVTGYNEQGSGVRVKITDPITEIPQEIIDAVNTNEYFFAVKFAAQLLEMDVRVLLDLLDSVQVILDTSQSVSLALSKTLDLGLNLIKRNEKKIVPNMVRLRNQGSETGNLFKIFFEAEISVDAVNLLYEYKKEHPEIFTFMNWRMGQLEQQARSSGQNVNFKEAIHAQDIYPDEKDPNKPVTKAYLWLLKQEEIYYHNAPINSKKVSKAKITKLLDYFRKMKQSPPLEKDVFFDPSYLYTQRLTEKGLFYLSKTPEVHAIQDRVICLNEAYFGERAVVIGISDYSYEVLFERPSFGKNDLGGLVDFLWGGKFDFRELFNIGQQSKLIEPRFKSNPQINAKRYWDGSRPDFISRYSGKAVSSMNQFQKINRYINCPFVLAEKMARAAKGETDDGFQIVTPKHNLRNFYPTDTERNVINQTHQENDQMKVVKQFAQRKNMLVEHAAQQKQQVPEAKRHDDFTQADNDVPSITQPQKVVTKPVAEVPVQEKKVQIKKPQQPKKKQFVKFVAQEPEKKLTEDNSKKQKEVTKGKQSTKQGQQKDKPKPKYVAKEVKVQEVKQQVAETVQAPKTQIPAPIPENVSIPQPQPVQTIKVEPQKQKQIKDNADTQDKVEQAKQNIDQSQKEDDLPKQEFDDEIFG